MTRTGALETQLSLDQAMERDDSGEWTERARWWIEAVSRPFVEGDDSYDVVYAEFTSDDLRAGCGDPPGTGNILGALLSQEVRAGRLEVVGRRKSMRPGRHRARLNVYRGRS